MTLSDPFRSCASVECLSSIVASSDIRDADSPGRISSLPSPPARLRSKYHRVPSRCLLGYSLYRQRRSIINWYTITAPNIANGNEKTLIAVNVEYAVLLGTSKSADL